MISPQKYKAKIEKIEKLAPKFLLFTLEFPRSFHFEAGQFVNIAVNDQDLIRAYSLASLPNDPKVKLLVDHSPLGIGSRFFLSRKKGDPLDCFGPLGVFTLLPRKDYPKDTLLFIATGSGIAPLRSQIQKLLREKDPRELHLFMGFRYPQDIVFQKEFEELSTQHPNFHFHLTLSRPEKTWKGNRGYVIKLLKKTRLPWSTSQAYLCGNPDMIKETSTFLQEKGLSFEKIRLERFH